MNVQNIEHIVVVPEDNGVRLDKWLLKSYINLNNSITQKLIRTGQIRVDGKRKPHNYLLQVGQTVRVPTVVINKLNSTFNKKKQLDTTKYIIAIENIVNSIVYKDKDIIIINKPSGIAVQDGVKVNFNITMAFEKLRFEYENNPFIVHRIDKDTSGVLILARHKLAARHMFELFKNKKIQKIYHCLVYPFLYSSREGIINAPLLKIGSLEAQKIVIDSQGKEAITQYKVLDARNKIGFLKIMPITGRTHQIRVHMSQYLKSPIIGDYKYNFRMLEALDINTKKLYLHATEVDFLSISGERIQVKVDLDNEYKRTLDKLQINYKEYLD